MKFFPGTEAFVAARSLVVDFACMHAPALHACGQGKQSPPPLHTLFCGMTVPSPDSPAMRNMMAMARGRLLSSFRSRRHATSSALFCSWTLPVLVAAALGAKLGVTRSDVSLSALVEGLGAASKSSGAAEVPSLGACCCWVLLPPPPTRARFLPAM